MAKSLLHLRSVHLVYVMWFIQSVPIGEHLGLSKKNATLSDSRREYAFYSADVHWET